MYRGISTFKCTQCGNVFKAPNYEYLATTYATPQKCPKCGGFRTRPAGPLGKLAEREYESIRERIKNK